MTTDQQSFRLILSERSPFARRIRMALRSLDLRVAEDIVNVLENPKTLVGKNPLGLVPTLWHPKHGWIYESSVILQILEEEHPGALWPLGSRRVQHLRISALATGIMGASVHYFLVTKMQETPSERWAADYQSSVVEGIEALAEELAQLPIPETYSQAHIDAGIALEYAELRLPDLVSPLNQMVFRNLLERLRNFTWFEASRPRL